MCIISLTMSTIWLSSLTLLLTSLIYILVQSPVKDSAHPNLKAPLLLDLYLSKSIERFEVFDLFIAYVRHY